MPMIAKNQQAVCASKRPLRPKAGKSEHPAVEEYGILIIENGQVPDRRQRR